eukprot:TRINITY_DN771_c1_g1_i1.p2 TRINITY_DN771_c1_g1~~TRINITY_DN771_c1_g1_i1.p2  ORF type:complete len:244 (-),score=101.92 TRINITY_DN771_c1_g1_i1:220-891(-)
MLHRNAQSVGLLLTIALAAFVLFYIAAPAEALSCGKVYSGPDFDRANNREQQSSKTRLQANWEGFNKGGSGRVTYRYAAISEDVATKAITDSGPFASNSKRCRDNSGLTKDADLVDFAFGYVGTNTSAKITRLPLKRHRHYYVIIQATQGKNVTYSNTDSIYVKDDDDDDIPAYSAGLIAMACAICCILLILLLLLLLLIAKLSRGDDKYTTTVHRNENVDKM